jgi:hypothetical protein
MWDVPVHQREEKKGEECEEQPNMISWTLWYLTSKLISRDTTYHCDR